MGTIWRVLTRKKNIDPNDENTGLARVLNTFDLTSLGVGSTLGVGVYVIAGHVAKEVAGPAVVLSFLIAAIASVFAGLCYAEFGARTPRAGSAYIYSYVCVGEFIAFIIGWNLILEYVIGSASVARGLSLYLDTLLNDTLKDTFTDIAPINVSFMSPYFDFFSFGIAILLSVGLAFGMKESSIVNNILTILNIMVVLFVVIAGSIKADAANWNISANETIPDIGDGGFFPFGVSGMLKGAATCFYGFVGFDCIATTGEEVKNPKRAIPVAIICSLAIIFLAYFSTSTVVTMMVPYYLQDVNAPIPHAFAEVGWNVAKWIVAIGAIFGLSASLFGAMFPLPRIIYAMATDGLVFKFLGTVNARFSTPVIGTLLAGFLTGLMSAMFDLKQLVNMMSIGTLLAYTIVAACVLLLRYEEYREMDIKIEDANVNQNETNETYEESVNFSHIITRICNFNRVNTPSKFSENLAAIFVAIYCILALLMGLCAMFLWDEIRLGRIYAIVLTSVVGFLIIIVLMSLSLQPTSARNLTFKVPLVPLIPALSILINIYLMLMLDTNTWIRFGVWMAVGIPIYLYCVFEPICAENRKMYKTFNKQINGYPPTFDDSFKKEDGSGKFLGSAQKGSEISATSDYGSMLSVEAKKAESSPVIENETQRYEVKPKKSISSVDVALEMLDDVIYKEETASGAMLNVDVRKLSADSISTASNVIVEENVVALVHREDIVSNPASPIKEIPEPVSFNFATKSDNLEQNTAQKVSQNHSVDDRVENIEFDTENDAENAECNAETKSDVYKNTNDLTDQEFVKISVELTCDNNKDKPSDGEDEEYGIENLNLNLNDDSLDKSIPLPPPLEDYEIYKTLKIPRVSEKRESLKKSPAPFTKLKNTSSPVLPAVDYSRQSSRKSSVSELSNDNVTFGTKAHERIKAKLTDWLQSNFGVQPPNKLTKPEVYKHDDENLPKKSASRLMSQVIAEIPKSANILNNNEEDNKNRSGEESGVDTSPINSSDIRNKLNEILRKSTKPPKKTSKTSNFNTLDNLFMLKNNENSSTDVNIVDPNKNNLSDRIDEDDHKKNMQNTLNSIRLRKLESFNDKDQDVNSDEKHVHKLKMGDTFAGIRLRKKESIKM